MALDYASPRLDNGWVRLAPAFGRAMAAACGSYRMVVLWTVIERTWGAAWWTRFAPGEPAPEALPCRLNLSALARECGASQADLSRAKVALVADGVLIEHPDRTLEPSKHYERWAFFKDRPKWLGWCRGGDRAMEEARAAGTKEIRTRAGRTPKAVEDPTPSTTTAAPELWGNAHKTETGELCGKPHNPPDELGANAHDSESELGANAHKSDDGLWGNTHNAYGGTPITSDDGLCGNPHSAYVETPIKRDDELCGNAHKNGVLNRKDLNLETGENSRPPAPARTRTREETAERTEPPGLADLKLERLHPPKAKSPGAAPAQNGEKPPRPAGRRELQYEGPPSRREQMEMAYDVFPGPIEPDEAEIQRACVNFAKWFPQEAFTQEGSPSGVVRQIHRHKRNYPSAWFSKVLKRLRVEGTDDPGWRLVFTILKRWDARGGPNRGKEDEYTDDLEIIKCDVPPAPPFPRNGRHEPPCPGHEVPKAVLTPRAIQRYGGRKFLEANGLPSDLPNSQAKAQPTRSETTTG